MVSNNFATICKNVSYTVFVNIISLIVSLLTVIILPKIMDITAYSYWQLYLFYCSYIVFINIGWIDGIYLRYGGYNYVDLPKNVFITQFWSLVVYLLIITSCMSIVFLTFNTTENKMFVLLATCISGLIYICRIYYQFILQSTNKLKEYANILLIDRILFSIMIALLIMEQFIEFKTLISIDILIKFITLLYAIIICRDITFGKFVSFRNAFKEVISNVSVGIKLTIANVAGILIVGIVRVGIEQMWSIETFGEISFTLSVNNLVLVFINAIGLVMFPVLCRAPQVILLHIYKHTRTALITPLLGIIILYYPVKLILSMWLPQYSKTLDYMALLFPIIIFESKMSLIINPYFKALRKEKLLLIINFIAVVVSLITTIITILIHDLTIIIVSITFLLAFRCILAELLLSKILSWDVKKEIALEISLLISFVCLNWYLNSWISIIVYTMLYLIYLVINKRSIFETLYALKTFVKKE